MTGYCRKRRSNCEPTPDKTVVSKPPTWLEKGDLVQEKSFEAGKVSGFQPCHLFGSNKSYWREVI
jgi:hypothetical protein